MPTPEQEICIHHWIIEEADGPYSRGECQICHLARDDFENFICTPEFNDETVVVEGHLPGRED